MVRARRPNSLRRATSTRDALALLPNVHPKLNTGKEPFKCGMENAECGVRAGQFRDT